MKNMWILIGMLLLSISLTDARLPEIGDHVRILVDKPDTDAYMVFMGKIADMDSSMICLVCTKSIEYKNNTLYSEYYYTVENLDRCIGTGSILSLTWGEEL